MLLRARSGDDLDAIGTTATLLPWLRYHNGVRPHGSLAKRTPFSQIG